MKNAYLGLGSNLGNKIANIDEAINKISQISGIEIAKVSSYYETVPVGYTDQPDFINCVVKIKTDIDPESLLKILLSIENDMGRVRLLKWGPRLIDIDILLYDKISIKTDDLVIPHPEMADRAFVIIPLAEIEPDLILHSGMSVKERALFLADKKRIKSVAGSA